ncbi:MAG: hypothetical protein ACRDHC_02920 [Actinomycetota bacterium]
MRTRTLPIALLTVALFAGACGRFNDDDGPGSGGIDHPNGADQLVLRIAEGGGFVPVEYNLRSIAGISIFGDGRMIVEGPMIEIYPGPALPNLQATRLTEDAIQAILQEARTAGLLGQDATYDYPCVTDLPTTTFTIVAEGRTHTVSAYALGFAEGAETSADCPGVDAAAREKLFDFQMKMGDLRSWLHEGSIGQEEPFAPTEMRIYVLPYSGDPELMQPPVNWPLSQTLQRFGDEDPNLADIRCGVIGGNDLEVLLPEARSANELTPWTSEGGEFSLIFRPLLPDEHTC